MNARSYRLVHGMVPGKVQSKATTGDYIIVVSSDCYVGDQKSPFGSDAADSSGAVAVSPLLTKSAVSEMQVCRLPPVSVVRASVSLEVSHAVALSAMLVAILCSDKRRLIVSTSQGSMVPDVYQLSCFQAAVAED